VARSSNLQSLGNRQFPVRVGVSLVRYRNVQVLHRVNRGQAIELIECRGLYFAAVLSDTAQQCYPRRAVGTVLPSLVLATRIAFPALQDPMRRVIHYPPSLVELGYELL
jgi:hypothetical protein